MNFKTAFGPIRSLQATFAAMNLAPAQLWGGGLLLALLDACASNSGQQNPSGGGPGVSNEILLIVACVGCGLGLAAFIGACWVRPGVFFNLKSVLETGEPDSKGIFDHRGRFVPLLLASLLKAVIFLAAGLLTAGPLIAAFFVALGGRDQELGRALMLGASAFFLLIGLPALIYLSSGLALVGEIVIFEGAKPKEALSRSWNMARGNRLRIFLYALVTGIFALLGLLLCCIGVLATSAVTTLAWAEAYLQLSGTGDDGPVESDPERLPDFP